MTQDTDCDRRIHPKLIIPTRNLTVWYSYRTKKISQQNYPNFHRTSDRFLGESRLKASLDVVHSNHFNKIKRHAA